MDILRAKWSARKMEAIISTLVNLAVHLLEGMFFLGALGSVVVLVLTTIDDVKVLFSSDHEKHEMV